MRVSVTFGEAQIEGWTRDIGPGGVSIEAGEQPPFGARVSLRLELLSSSGPATLPGTVRWVTSTTFGVQFGLLRAFDTWALNQLVRGSRG